MAYRSKFVIAIVSAAIAFYSISGVLFGWSNTSAQQPINDPGAQIRIFESVLQHIQNDYVDEPDLAKVRNGAMRGLADGLDPYSSYLTAEQVRDYRNNKDAGKVGIGAAFSQVSSYLYIISVVKGSPAEKAGLMSGDVIEYIETKATRDISLYDALELILGAPGSKVKLRVLRARSKPLTVEVTRGRFTQPPAESSIVQGTAHVRINSLAKGESESVRKIVSDLKSKGINKIVLDVRNVATGELLEATAVANLFVKTGKLATIIGREQRVIETFEASPDRHLFDGQLVVLADRGTAGTGEVIASAILDNKRGEVVGERTFGAGAVQELFTMSGGDGFLLTKAKWASPSGLPFLAVEREDRGIKPSVEVLRPEAPEPVEVEDLIEGQNEGQAQPPVLQNKRSKEEDLQLKKALELLSGKSKAASSGV